MMANIPVRFKRITAAFDDVARARLCESSGSEHSASENSVTDLSDLIDSFLERGDGDGVDHQPSEGKKSKKNKKKKSEEEEEEEEGDCSETESSYVSSAAETKEMLMRLIGGDTEADDSGVRRMVVAELEKACRSLGNRSSEGFKRGVMTYLRQRGFDAGLCKSRWAKTGRHPAGEYDYIDVLINSKRRYIIEVSLVTEFTIARPSKTYASLLEAIPYILIIKEGELKQMVRLMCNEMRLSLKKRDMHVPPWRTNGYLQSKWFASYKRTTNAVSKSDMASRVGELAGKSLLGFELLPAAGYCRKDVVRKAGLHVGNLTAVFSGMP